MEPKRIIKKLKAPEPSTKPTKKVGKKSSKKTAPDPQVPTDPVPDEDVFISGSSADEEEDFQDGPRDAQDEDSLDANEDQDNADDDMPDNFMDDFDGMFDEPRLDRRMKICGQGGGRKKRYQSDEDEDEEHSIDEEPQDLGPYNGECEEEEELSAGELDFDQGIQAHKDEDKLITSSIRQEKKTKNAVWEQLEGTEAPNLPSISKNKSGGPVIPVPEGEDPEAYKLKLKQTLTPAQAFHYFFPEELYDLMLDQTSIYCNQEIEKGYVKKIRKEWGNLTIEDFKNYVGLSIWMGIHKLPHIQHHWSTNPLYLAGFRNCMKKNRWRAVNKMFHLNDNMKADKKDPLYKIRPFIDVIEQRFVTMYEIGENVSIDEAMVRWQGTLFFKQLMKGKPIKWGIKLFLLSDSKNGYCHSFKVYTGKKEDMFKFRNWEGTLRYLAALKAKRLEEEKQLAKKGLGSSKKSAKEDAKPKKTNIKDIPVARMANQIEALQTRIQLFPNENEDQEEEEDFDEEEVYIEMPKSSEILMGPPRPLRILPDGAIKIEESDAPSSIKVELQEAHKKNLKAEEPTSF